MSHSEAKIEETPADPYVAETISSDETVKSPKKKPGRKPKQKLVISEFTQDVGIYLLIIVRIQWILTFGRLKLVLSFLA